MVLTELNKQVEEACRRLLSEQNRDPYSPTNGCFDRRYWGWKLVDYPEATFQRNVWPLAWSMDRSGSEPAARKLLAEAVEAGLKFACRVQHRDGSFDQAFPNEHSFGATAFLLDPLLKAYRAVRENCPPSSRLSIEDCLYRAADHLCRNDERHGFISNHLAGAVLSLLTFHEFSGERRFEERADQLLSTVLSCQSEEGWFPEYGGADPGYQTLCLYYLAQVYLRRPWQELRRSLEKSLSFLSWFIHPDGTFSGEYGSRRTAVYYPGGIALLSEDFPLAHRISLYMLQSIARGRTVTLHDIDMGNLAPLLSNYIAALDAKATVPEEPPVPLPSKRESVCQDFPEAGLYIRGSVKYYAVLGVSNGGVLRVFHKDREAPVWNDAGYIGETEAGDYVTTQITDLGRTCRVAPDEISFRTSFFKISRLSLSPFSMVILRLANLTLMRSSFMRNLIKKMMVRRLITASYPTPMQLTRRVHFGQEQVTITDSLSSEKRDPFRWLEFGRPFSAIHMASAHYFEGFPFTSPERDAGPVDVRALNRDGRLEIRFTV